MSKARIWELTGFKDSGLVLLARVRLADGTYITQDSINEIRVIVQHEDGTETLNTTLTKTVVISDALVTDDPRWTRDTTGRNFAYEVPYTAFTKSGHWRIEIHFSPGEYQPFPLVWEGAIFSRFDTPS